MSNNLLDRCESSRIPATTYRNRTASQDAGVGEFAATAKARAESCAEKSDVLYVVSDRWNDMLRACAAMGKVLVTQGAPVRFFLWSEFRMSLSMFQRSGYMDPESDSFADMRGYWHGYLIIPDLFWYTGSVFSCTAEDKEARDRVTMHLLDGGSLIFGGREKEPSLMNSILDEDLLNLIRQDYTAIQVKKAKNV